MATLTGKAIASTYTSLLKLEGDAGSTVAGGSAAVQVKTGDNDDTPLYLNTDRVGIGTAAPQYLLHLSASGNVYLGINSTNSATAGIRLQKGSTTDTNMTLYRTTDDFRLSTGGSDRLTILSGGNVGIGTASPENLLHVEGSSATIQIEASNNTGSVELLMYADQAADNADMRKIAVADGGKMGFATYSTGSWVDQMVILDSGNVGIGTAGPSNNLEVAGRSGEACQLLINTASGYDAELKLGNAGSTKWTIYNDAGSSNKLIIKDDGDDRVTIQQDGNVGIGTTGPAAKLVVKVDDNDNVSAIEIDQNDSTNNRISIYSDHEGSGDMIYMNGSAGKFQALGTGQIKALHHYSNAAGSTQTALFVDDSGFFGKVTSLREHKKKIADMENVNWLYDIRPVNFEYKVMETEEKEDRDGNIEEIRTGKRLDEADGKKQYGMIAEELAEVSGAESLLEYDGDKLSGISYHKFVPILIKAIQELSAKVTALENA